MDDVKYKLKSPPNFKSKFLLEMEKREKMKMKAEALRQQEEHWKMIRKLEKPPPDAYSGHRIHAWVLILPEKKLREREIVCPLFIEPSTGSKYKLTDYETGILYLGIESIWNDQNYWVNMQRRSTKLEDINWNLTKVELWEHLLPGEPWHMQGIEEYTVDEEVGEEWKHLDMPLSYVNRIVIDKLDYCRRYPNGHKTLYYRKTSVDLYGPYIQTDGLTERITVYDDYKYTIPLQICETYSNRADNLIKSEKNIVSGDIIDYYKRGRPDACKEYRYVMPESKIADSAKILDFYSVVRLDGLSRIETHPFYLTQHYVDREDFLYYRHVEFYSKKNISSDSVHPRHVCKITEKFHRNETIPASKDIAIREFAVMNKKIHLKFHYEKNRSTRAVRTFTKPEIGDHSIFHSGMVQEYNPDPTYPQGKNLDLFYELQSQLKAEDRCLSYVRDAEDEIASFLKLRTAEYLKPVLTVSLYDEKSDLNGEPRTLAMTETLHRHSAKEIMEDADYLGPYLARIGDPTHISKAQAYVLREDCLSDFKQLQVDRGNHLLQKIVKQTEELNKMQLLLTQNEDLTQEEEETMLAETDKMNFNLHLLQIRLNRHKDLVSLRYKTLVEFLKSSEHLTVLQKS